MPWLSIMTRFHALVLVVEEANIELAWKNVKANRGAPGPDGITITEFPDWFRPRWNAVRQQLLEGTYPSRIALNLRVGPGTFALVRSL